MKKSIHLSKKPEDPSCVRKIKQVVTYPNPQGGKPRENPFLLGRKLAQNLFRSKDSNFDYLVTFSDGIAQGVAQCLDKKGVAIPVTSKFLVSIN